MEKQLEYPASLPGAVETPVMNPMVLLERAQASGTGAEELKQWMDLYDRWTAEEARKSFFSHMHAAQQSMPLVVRDAKNIQTNSRYAKLETIQNACRPTYAGEGFSLVYGEADCPLDNHKRTVCDVIHVDGHFRQYQVDLPVDGKGPQGKDFMSAVQGAKSTISYAQKMLLCMIFNITIADSDNDGQDSDEMMSENQLNDIDDLMHRSGTDPAVFFEKIGRKGFDDMTAHDYSVWRPMLVEKIRIAEAKKGGE